MLDISRARARIERTSAADEGVRWQVSWQEYAQTSTRDIEPPEPSARTLLVGTRRVR